MTLTNAVQSLAHDAANAATDLGSQAAEMGSKATEMGADAASAVAAAATNLAHSIGKKVPGVQSKRKPAKMRLVIIVGIVLAAAYVFVKGRHSSAALVPETGFETARAGDGAWRDPLLPA